jgi:hypothetical protein
MKCMKLTFSEWSVKFHISAVARALFNVNVHFRILFSLSDERDVQLTRQLCSVCQLTFILKGWMFKF